MGAFIRFNSELGSPPSTVIHYRIKSKLVVQVFERITVNPQQCSGRPYIRGMRIRVRDVLELLADGIIPEQILEEQPDLEIEDIQACLR